MPKPSPPDPKPDPQQAPSHDPTPALARQVLDLYGSTLRDVRFPDLDLALLEEARDALWTSQLEVERAEALLFEARAALDLKAEALHAKAERALAYARVFALGDVELTARLAEIGARKKPLASVTATGALAAIGGASAVKRRGRGKNSVAGSELFVADEAERESTQPLTAADGG